jgi:mRNA interferase MazF
MRRGEVWWHEPPDRKARPVLILTRDEAIEGVFDLMAVPATKTIRGIPTEVEIGAADGMPIECALALDNTFSAQKVYFTTRITTLDSARMHRVCRALAYATSC